MARGVTVKPTGCGFDPHSRRWNIYLNLYFHSSLWCRGQARRWVLPLNTQCLQNSAESGERSVLTLDGYLVSVYPAVCGIQLEADLFIYVKLNNHLHRRYKCLKHIRFIPWQAARRNKLCLNSTAPICCGGAVEWTWRFWQAFWDNEPINGYVGLTIM